MHVDVRIDDLVARTPVADDQQFDVTLGAIEEPVRVSGPGRKSRAHSGLEQLFASVGFQHHFAFQHELSAELKTLYVQEMLRRGFLATTAMYVTLAHTEEIVERYTEAIDAVFEEIAEALGKNEVAARLQGPVAHDTFSRLL